MADGTFQAAHCRAARALLDLTQDALAKAADVGRMTVKRFEADETIRPAQAAAIRNALEKRGILFIHEGMEIRGRSDVIGVVMVATTPAPD
jgi:DNA-binding XRE family transcriptional regulator